MHTSACHYAVELYVCTRKTGHYLFCVHSTMKKMIVPCKRKLLERIMMNLEGGEIRTFCRETEPRRTKNECCGSIS